MASGMGDWATGMGSFLRQAAEAEAIHYDSEIKRNEYLYLSSINAAQRRSARFKQEKEKRDIAQLAIRTRIRFSPDCRDVESGDALNALALELADVKVHPSALRSVPVALPDGIFGQLPLHLSRVGVVIAPSRLRAERPWPALLQCTSFARGRATYERAVGTSLSQAARGTLFMTSVEAVDRAIADLRRCFEQSVLSAPLAERAQARTFLDGLDRSARMLHEPGALAVLERVLNRPGRTVADLLNLEQQFHLQFAPAESAEERALYQDLYHLLVKQHRLLIMLAHQRDEEQMEVASVERSGSHDSNH
jgi:hypothetical protein